MAIRCATARSVVLYMKMGMRVEAALAEAMVDLRALDDPYAAGMNIVAMDRDGNPAAATNRPGATFVYQTGTMDTHTEQPRMLVPDVRGGSGFLA